MLSNLEAFEETRQSFTWEMQVRCVIAINDNKKASLRASLVGLNHILKLKLLFDASSVHSMTSPVRVLFKLSITLVQKIDCISRRSCCVIFWQNFTMHSYASMAFRHSKSTLCLLLVYLRDVQRFLLFYNFDFVDSCLGNINDGS